MPFPSSEKTQEYCTLRSIPFGVSTVLTNSGDNFILWVSSTVICRYLQNFFIIGRPDSLRLQEITISATILYNREHRRSYESDEGSKKHGLCHTHTKCRAGLVDHSRLVLKTGRDPKDRSCKHCMHLWSPFVCYIPSPKLRGLSFIRSIYRPSLK